MKYPIDKQPTLRIVTAPGDANLNGSIFGGWLMSQIDIAGSIDAAACAKGGVATVAVKSLQFMHPLFPYDYVSFYTDILHVGKTSVTVQIDVYAQRQIYGDAPMQETVKVAKAVFVYVAVSTPGKKRII